MGCAMHWEPPSGDSWALLSSSQQSGLPALTSSPPCGLTTYSFLRLSPVGSHG